MQPIVKEQKQYKKLKKYKKIGEKKLYLRECDQIATPMEWIDISDVLRYISSQGISVFINDIQRPKRYFIDKTEMTDVESLIYANKIRLRKKLPPFHLESITIE